jgi:hypothetical protein
MTEICHGHNKQDRQCTYRVTLWHICVTNVATKTQHVPFCCLPNCSCQHYKNALPQKCNNDFPLHCCPATKYFVLLSTSWMYLGLHVKSPLHLSPFNQIWSFLTDFHEVSNIKFHANLSSRSRVDTHRRMDRWTDMKLKRAFVTMQTCLTSDIHSLVSIMMVTEHSTLIAHKKI